MKVEIKKGDMPSYKKGYPNNHVILGGDDSNPTWEEYLDQFKDEFRPCFIVIKKAIEEAGMVGELASNVCNDTYFSFEEGTQIAFTWRAWGDLMQAIVNKKEGYMTYYM